MAAVGRPRHQMTDQQRSAARIRAHVDQSPLFAAQCRRDQQRRVARRIAAQKRNVPAVGRPRRAPFVNARRRDGARFAALDQPDLEARMKLGSFGRVRDVFTVRRNVRIALDAGIGGDGPAVNGPSGAGDLCHRAKAAAIASTTAPPA